MGNKSPPAEGHVALKSAGQELVPGRCWTVYAQLTASTTGNNGNASLGASEVLLLFPTSTILVLCLVFPPFTFHREPELTQ